MRLPLLFHILVSQVGIQYVFWDIREARGRVSLPVICTEYPTIGRSKHRNDADGDENTDGKREKMMVYVPMESTVKVILGLKIRYHS